MEVAAEVEAAAYELWRAWDVALGQMVVRCCQQSGKDVPYTVPPLGKAIWKAGPTVQRWRLQSTLVYKYSKEEKKSFPH